MFKYFDINVSGYSIRSKLYAKDPKDVRRAVIFCHGFGGHKDNRACERFAAKILSKNKGYAVIAFDWPCHGEDARKKLSLSECDFYLSSVIEHVNAQFHPEALFALGTSFGGYLLLKYIKEHQSPFKKIALRCPAVNMYDSLTHVILTEENKALLSKGKPILAGFDRKVQIDREFLDELKACDIRNDDFMDFADDILILHGTKDEIVAYSEVSAFAENNLIDLITSENADHRYTDPKLMDSAIHDIIEFYEMA